MTLIDIARNADYLPGITHAELEDMLLEIERTHVEGIPGEICELGCAQGMTTTYFRRALNQLSSPKQLHVFDSFQGLPAKRPEDGSDPNFHEGMFAIGPEVLMLNFSCRNLSLPVIHTGWFGEIVDYPERIAFAFLDGDFYDSIMDGLNAIWPHLSPGARVAIHDCHHADFPGAFKAASDFAREHHLILDMFQNSGLRFVQKP